MTDKKFRILDLFCGAGGACRGYQMAGFYVVGVYIKPQPRYCGEEFHRADALECCREHGHEFDAIHASPPCQRYAAVTAWRGSRSDHPDLVDATRKALELWSGSNGRPWVMENVREAPLRRDLLLCGTMFGLHVRRHRVFEMNWQVAQAGPCMHSKQDMPFIHKAERAYADAMGVTWANKVEARQCVPPVYTEYIGCGLMEYLLMRAIGYDKETFPSKDDGNL